MRVIYFNYHNEEVSFTWHRGYDSKTVVSCQHPVFVSVFGSPTVVDDSLKWIVDRGMLSDDDFFRAMLSGFMSYRTAV